MDSTVSYFSLPLGEPHNLPSTSLLETDDVFQQFLSADDPLEEPDLNGPTTLHCEICSKKFDNAKKYYGHLRVHTKDNLWICDKCPDQRFSTKQNLMKHSLVHNPLKKVWKCPQCPLAFEALWRLQQHLFAKHLKRNTHKCDVCEKSFQKLSDLKKHKNIHSDVKQFKCTQCDKGFNTKSNLKVHMYTHTKEKPFVCKGCGRKYTQLSNLIRHKEKCPKYGVIETKETRRNHCRTCGLSFQYKSTLVEHSLTCHTNTANTSTQAPSLQILSESRTVDTIVNDLLSVEDDYPIRSTNQNITTELPATTFERNNVNPEENTDNLMHIEFLKDMSELHALDDELFYNGIDFDSLPNHVFVNEEFNHPEREAEIPYDYTDDQELLNALIEVKGDNLPEDLLNVYNDTTNLAPTETTAPNSVLVNECSTIFESDVDLEASTNLAMNLNQLIGENSVQYVSTEDDDTFIISLNSTIDAEKLTDMLNIGVEVLNENHQDKEKIANEEVNKTEKDVEDAVVIKYSETLPNTSVNNENDSNNQNNKPKVKLKKQVLYVCVTCNKVFRKKENYKSHLAIHQPSLSRHRCKICGVKFGYKSSLNKHVAQAHRPVVLPAFTCEICGIVYKAKWMLKNHRERDHERLTPYECEHEGCDKKFYKKNDLDKHRRFHTKERPFKCDVCLKDFPQKSHLLRHIKKLNCAKFVKKKAKEMKATAVTPTPNVVIFNQDC